MQIYYLNLKLINYSDLYKLYKKILKENGWYFRKKY